MDLHTKPESELLKKFTKCGYIYKSPAIGDKHQLLLSCLHCNEVFCQLENFMEHSLKHLELGDFYADAVQEDSIDMENTIIKTEKIECQSETLNPDVIVLKQEDSNRKVYYDILEQEDNEFFELLPETIKSENNEGIERPANIDGHHVRENDNHIEDDCDPEVELESRIHQKKAKRRIQLFDENSQPGNLHRKNDLFDTQNSDIMPIKTLNNDSLKNNTQNSDLDDLKAFISDVVDSKFKELREVLTSQNRQVLELLAENSILLNKLFKVERDVENTILEFPIASIENLQDLDSRLKKIETFNRYVAAFKKILYHGNLSKRFKDIFSLEIILDCNYDGIHGKRKFKEFKNVNAALFKAVMTDDAKDDDYIKEIRNAFKCIKRAHFKKVSVNNRSQNLS